MGLKDRDAKRRQPPQQTQAQPADGAGMAPHGVVTNITTFQTPIYAKVGNDAVSILATGNVPGFSPGYLCVDGQGYSTWVPLSDARIIDTRFLPLKLL